MFVLPEKWKWTEKLKIISETESELIKKANNSELIKLFLIFKGEEGNWIERVNMILERESEPIKKSNKYEVSKLFLIFKEGLAKVCFARKNCEIRKWK